MLVECNVTVLFTIILLFSRTNCTQTGADGSAAVSKFRALFVTFTFSAQHFLCPVKVFVPLPARL